MSDKEGQNGGDYFSKEARIQLEHDKFFEAMGEEASKIEEGTDISPEQLDKYLTAATELYQLKTHNQGYHGSMQTSAEWSFKFQNALRGTYQQEKATFAVEEADYYRDEATYMDESTQAKYNKYAANWLRTAANCLEMPTARPPVPEQQEGT